MAEETPSSTAPPPSTPPAPEAAAAVQESPEVQESRSSLAAMMEKDGSQSPPPAEEKTEEVVVTTSKEEVVVVDTGKQKQQQIEEQSNKIPQSLASFKEESSRVSDLSEPERKSLDEFKRLVQEAIDTHQFTSSLPLPLQQPKEEEKKTASTVTHEETPAPSKAETEAPVSESDVSTEITPAAAAESGQESKVEENLEKVSQEETAAKANASPPEEEVSIWGIPLLKDDRSDVILLKFLRARDFKVRDAFVMIRNTILWRRQFKIEELLDEDLGDDLEKVVFMHGHDKDGHPVCYNVYGEFQNKELYKKCFSDEEKRMRFLRWRIQFLERSIRKLNFTPGGISTIFQVNDFKNSPGPGKRELRIATREALHLLQDNYPEFVAKQVFINVPWWYLAFYTMISPFMTQRTKSKFVFASPAKSAETLFKYISPEQVPVQYGGLSVDNCDCNPDFTVDDPVTEITVKPGTKQTVEIILYEKCLLVWEVRVVGWEVTYGAEFVPDAKDAYTIIIQKSTKMAPTAEPVVSHSFKVGELGKILLIIDNPTSKKKKLLYRFKIKPFSD